MWLAATLTFVLLHLAPGDPVTTALDSERIPESVREAWRAQLGLDRPLPEQYVRWLAGLARGEMGWSVWRRAPVRDVVLEALPRTLLLTGSGLLVAFALGVPLGAAQAMRRGGLLDRVGSAVTVTLRAVPEFLVALALFVVFTWRYPLFPPGGMLDPVMYEALAPGARLLDRLRHLVLPVLALGLVGAATISRYQRAAMRDVLTQDFVRTARAKGGSERTVLRHALRNALQPTIAIAGLALPALFGGAFFVEAVFMWPGIGTLAVGAIGARDYALALALVVAGAALVVLGGLLADALARWVDPRLRRP